MQSSARDLLAKGLVRVEAAKLRLRAFEARDAGAVFALYHDKEAVRFGYSPKMDDVDDARRLVDHTVELANAGEIFHWGVAQTSDDEIIGHATLFNIELEHRRAEIGYSVQRGAWGRGLGTDTVGLIVAYAFEALDLHRLEADVDPRNHASLRVLEKNGFVREGFMRQRWHIQGEIQDSIFFGLIRPEWQKRDELAFEIA